MESLSFFKVVSCTTPRDLLGITDEHAHSWWTMNGYKLLFSKISSGFSLLWPESGFGSE
jgi:hypothetical protein